jgi:hypothetical protein
LGCPVWHVPGKLTRDSGSKPLGTSMLQGSHCGSNHTGDNGSGRRFALLVPWWQECQWWCPVFGASCLACTWLTCKRLR